MLRRMFAVFFVTIVVSAGFAVSDTVGAVPIQVPETLSDGRPVQAGPVDVEFPIDFLGVVWNLPAGVHHAPEGHGHHDAPHGEVRFRHDGVWSEWRPLIEDGAQAEGHWSSGLVPAGDADAYQVRGVPDHAAKPWAVALNSTDGPLVTVGTRPAGAVAALDNCQSRAEWGADESYRWKDSDGDGTLDTERWPTDYYTPQVMTVHHTATSNDDTTPEATIRAIYKYHALPQDEGGGNGWGDIGYQYLIDQYGVVYEGRWSDPQDPANPGDDQPSTPCGGGGDGSDFAHDDGTPGQVVTAAHTGGWNSGNVGVAILGEFTDHPRWGDTPTELEVDTLEDVLAELSARHGIDPTDENYTYVNPVNGETKTVATISGHRDYVATECPGESLYDLLPQIRQDVAAKAGSSDGDSGGDDGSGGDDDSGTADGMHVGDLDGSAAKAPRGHWVATVDTLVLDATGTALTGATVTGTWSSGSPMSVTCTTGSDGRCSVQSGEVHKSTSSLTFTVTAVEHADHTYDSASNTDPDGDSDGTSVTVDKP